MSIPTSAPTFDFGGTVVVVTGAATGIGLAVTEAFASSGASVALVDRSPSVLEVAGRLGAPHRGWVADVSDATAVEEVAKQVISVWKRADVLVNNAGIGPLAPAEDFPIATWDSTIAVNLRGAFLFTRAVVPYMIACRSGRIINMASQASVIGIEGHLAYCASKAGLLGMTRCMALEWGPRGLTVNAVSPTVIETELGLTGWSGERGERARAAIPTRRFGKPQEVAAAVMFLASDGASMINGANIMIDGGYTIA